MSWMEGFVDYTKVPTSLEECYKPNSIANALNSWAKGIRIAGLVGFIILTLYALVAAFEISDMGGDATACLIAFVTAFLLAAAEFVVALCTGLILDAYASVVKNTKINANLALYNAVKEEKAK